MDVSMAWLADAAGLTFGRWYWLLEPKPSTSNRHRRCTIWSIRSDWQKHKSGSWVTHLQSTKLVGTTHKKLMKLKVKLAPSGMVDRAGTHHGTPG